MGAPYQVKLEHRSGIGTVQDTGPRLRRASMRSGGREGQKPGGVGLGLLVAQPALTTRPERTFPQAQDPPHVPSCSP